MAAHVRLWQRHRPDGLRKVDLHTSWITRHVLIYSRLKSNVHEHARQMWLGTPRVIRN